MGQQIPPYQLGSGRKGNPSELGLQSFLHTPHTNSSHSGTSRDAEDMTTNRDTGTAETTVSLAAFHPWKQLQNRDLPLTLYGFFRGLCVSPSPAAIRGWFHGDSEPPGFQALQGKHWPKHFLTSNFSSKSGQRHSSWSSWSGGAAGSLHPRNSSISWYSRRNRPPKTSFPPAAFLTLPNYSAHVGQQTPHAGRARFSGLPGATIVFLPDSTPSPTLW